MRGVAVIVLLVFCQASMANSNQDTLWINHDTTYFDSVLFHYCAFNETNAFETENVALELTPGDTLNLLVINNDTTTQDFTIDGLIQSGNVLLPGDTGVFQITLSTEGTYRYYSSFAKGQLLGASGILLVGYEQYDRFYWNMFDADDTTSNEIVHGLITSIPTDYRPEHFSFNGYDYPETLQDSTSLVVGNVGDTIIISMLNSATMVHSIHFHGYHVKLLQLSQNTHMVNWVKDSFPVLPGETVTVELIPHQPGTYPVHDHNLIAVTSAGTNPGGMLTMLNISP